MQWIIEAFEAVRDFMELGGPVLTLIAWTIFGMWALIVERMIYFRTDLKAMGVDALSAARGMRIKFARR
jgi:biopolymer transport protein ExbB